MTGAFLADGATLNLAGALAEAERRRVKVSAGLRAWQRRELLVFQDELKAAGVPWTPGRRLPPDNLDAP